MANPKKMKIYRVIQIANDQWQLTCLSEFLPETSRVNWDNFMLRNEGKKHKLACFVSIQGWRHKALIRNRISLGINNATFTSLIQLSMNTITVKFPFAVRYIREFDAFLTETFCLRFSIARLRQMNFSDRKNVAYSIKPRNSLKSWLCKAVLWGRKNRFVHNNKATCNRVCLTNTFPSFVLFACRRRWAWDPRQFDEEWHHRPSPIRWNHR